MPNYSPVRGRRVAVWPDNDTPGLKAGKVAAQMAHAAGATSVVMLAPCGNPDGGGGASDIAGDLRYDVITERLITADPYEPEPTPATPVYYVQTVMGGGKGPLRKSPD